MFPVINFVEMILPASSDNSLGEIYILFVKGYLRYKMMTFRNLPSEAQVKNILFHRKVMFRSQDIQVFVLLIVP